MATTIWTGDDADGDWTNANNWSNGVPGNGDDVYIEDTDEDITTNLNQAAVTLATLTIAKSYTGDISGSAGEYLQIGSPVVKIGEYQGPGTAPSGSGLLKLDLGATASTVDIFDAGTPNSSEDPAIYLLAANATTVIRIRKGKVSIAPDTGETSTVGTIHVSYVTQQSTDADVQIGSGVTLSTLLLCKGGDTKLLCAGVTVTLEAGTLLTEGSGTITTLNISGGTATLNSTGTITTMNVSDSGTADFTKSSAARTVTTPRVDPNGKIKYDPSIVTLTNKIQPVSSSGDVQFTASAA